MLLPLDWLYLTFIDFSRLAKLKCFQERYNNYVNDIAVPLSEMPFQWTIQDVSNYVSSWLTSKRQFNNISMVAVMCSAEFALVIADCLGAKLAMTFHALIISTSLLRSGNICCPHSLEEGSSVINYAGFEILRQLEYLISSRKFKLLSLPPRLGLFLVLIGSIIATTYHRNLVDVRSLH